MGIKLKTEEGFEFSFDTVEELMEFTQRMNAVTESTTDEGPSEDENEVPESEPKFEVGDEVKVVENTSSGHVNGTIGEIVGVEYFESENRWSYVVHPISDYLFEQSLRHKESDLELFEDDIEVGDKVRVISAKDGTSVTFHKFDMGSIVEVEEVYGNGRIEAYDGVLYQTLLHHHYEKVEIQEEQEFKVGDWVKVVGNSYGHLMETGEVREITSVDSVEPKYNLSEMRAGYWVGTSDIETVYSSPKFQTGDIVRVTEEFEDHFGDRAKRGSVYEYDENFGFAEPFVGTVFLEDNIDKLELVCRAQDRLDK